MTVIDLTTLHFLKVSKKVAFTDVDLINLVYVIVAVKRQPKRIWEIISNDSKTIVKNISKISKKYLYLKKFFCEDIASKLEFSEFEKIAFICWYAYKYLNFKSFQKNTIDKITNDLIDKFKYWYKELNANTHIVYGFKQSCKTILNLCKVFETPTECINRLIKEDKISEVYYTGGISAYFLAAIPKRKINIPKTALFSNKLFSLIEQNKELLISKLNLACKNYLKIPIDSLAYLNALQKAH